MISCIWSDSTALFFLFDLALTSSSFPVTTILAHTPVIHLQLHIFANICARDEWSVGTKLVGITFTSTDAAARAVQPWSYSLFHFPFLTFHFCTEDVSNMSVMFKSSYFITQKATGMLFTADNLAGSKICTDGKLQFPLFV